MNYPKCNDCPTSGPCYQKCAPKKVKVMGIRPRSEKRASQDKEYSKLKRLFLIANPKCKIKQEGCKGKATDIHHTKSGADRLQYFLEMDTWLGTCRSCHLWVHNFPQAAKTLGFLK